MLDQPGVSLVARDSSGSKMSLIQRYFNTSPTAFQAQGLRGLPLNKELDHLGSKRHQMEGYSSSGLQGGARGDHRQRRTWAQGVPSRTLGASV